MRDTFPNFGFPTNFVRINRQFTRYVLKEAKCTDVIGCEMLHFIDITTREIPGSRAMSDRHFTLELSDGTTLQVSEMRNAGYPDVKAFCLPSGSLKPFSHQNLPRAGSSESSSNSALANAG